MVDDSDQDSTAPVSRNSRPQTVTWDCYDGWQQYPQQLPTWNSFCYNSTQQLRTIDQHALSLFASETEVHVIDAAANAQYKAEARSLRTATEVEEHIAQDNIGLRIISIVRKHSLKPLQISKATMLKILHRQQIGTVFLDLLLSFRNVEELSEKGHSIWSPIIASRESSEICYQLKYMEKNDHSQGVPWSERQIGVYHCFGETESAVMILLHTGPNSEAQRRLQEVFANGQYRQPRASSPLLLHALVISTYLDNWRWVLDYYGNQCQDKENKGFTVNLHSPSLNFLELQTLRNLQSKLLVYYTILEATQTTINALELAARQLAAASSSDHGQDSGSEEPIGRLARSRYPEIQALTTLKLKCEGFIRSIQVLQNRADKLTNLLADALNLKSQNATMEIADSTFELTQQSVDDNAIVRVITVITLIYLPTQGVATFFGMNLTSLPEATNRISFAKDWWLFVAISIPLTLITLGVLGIAWLAERNKKLKRQSAKKSKDS